MNLEELKNAFKKGGVDNLHIVADFDRTLTKSEVNGEKVFSIISVLYNDNHLSPEYSVKAKELHNKYYAIEVDPNVSQDEKKKAMEEWWTKHFDLLIESGLNRKDIEKVINSGKIVLRDGFDWFFDFLEENNIPLVIMSSSGLGGDSIYLCLKKEKKKYDNIFIISNSFKWDEGGRALSVNKPIIHGMNKNETSIESFPEIYEKIKNRKNVILLGDTLSDIDMVAGFKYDNLIKVGFLNDKIEESLEKYKEAFDIVITNNGSLESVNQLLKKIKHE